MATPDRKLRAIFEVPEIEDLREQVDILKDRMEFAEGKADLQEGKIDNLYRSASAESAEDPERVLALVRPIEVDIHRIIPASSSMRSRDKSQVPTPRQTSSSQSIPRLVSTGLKEMSPVIFSGFLFGATALSTLGAIVTSLAGRPFLSTALIFAAACFAVDSLLVVIRKT